MRNLILSAFAAVLLTATMVSATFAVPSGPNNTPAYNGGLNGGGG